MDFFHLQKPINKVRKAEITKAAAAPYKSKSGIKNNIKIMENMGKHKLRTITPSLIFLIPWRAWA